MEEQCRIADILWELEAARRAFAAAAGDVQAFRASTLQTYFSDLGRGKSTTLSEVAQVRTGLAKGKRYPGVPTTHRPYLRVANVQDGYLDLNDIKMIEVPVGEVSRYALEVGDVLITEGGDFDKVGRGTLWDGEIPCCLHQNHIFAVRTDKDRLLPEYLAMHLDSASGKTYFLNCAKKTSNLASINSSQVRAFPVRLAPLEVQRERCARVRLIDGVAQALTKHDMSALVLLRRLRCEVLTVSFGEE